LYDLTAITGISVCRILGRQSSTIPSSQLKRAPSILNPEQKDMTMVGFLSLLRRSSGPKLVVSVMISYSSRGFFSCWQVCCLMELM